MKDRSSVKIGGQYYEMRFSISAYEEIMDRLPAGSDVKAIIDHMKTPTGTCEVSETLIRAAEGEAPTAAELKNLCLVIDLAALRTAAIEAISIGMGIETSAEEDVDEDLLEVEKKTNAAG